MENRLEKIINLKLNNFEIKVPNKFEPIEKGEDDPCWEGYAQLGTKIVDGKEVPNCVPIKEEQSKVKKEGFPIPSPNSDEDESKFMSRCISEISGEYEEDQAIAICIGKWQGE